MASITSVISLFVLLLAAYCNAVPLTYTTEKPMLTHHTTERMFEHTTFGNMMAGEKHEREDNESESEETTTERVIKREEEEPTMKRTFEDVSFPSVELTTEMHKIRNMEFDDATFPTSTFEDHTEETRSFEHDKDMKVTTESLSHEEREFEHDSSSTLESSTEFADRAIRGSPEWFERAARASPEWFERQARASPEWFERSVRASPEWFERTARNYAEPEIEEEKTVPVKHISLDKIKTIERTVDSYGKTADLLHEEIKPIVTEIKTILPVEDSYTHVEKIVPETIHEIKLLHEEKPMKKVLVNDYETKVFHEDMPMKKVLVNDYETKIFHEEKPMKKVLVNDYETKIFHEEKPMKKVLVNDYETVKPALEQVKVKTVLLKKDESY